jgi:hypothetical protein
LRSGGDGRHDEACCGEAAHVDDLAHDHSLEKAESAGRESVSERETVSWI